MEERTYYKCIHRQNGFCCFCLFDVFFFFFCDSLILHAQQWSVFFSVAVIQCMSTWWQRRNINRMSQTCCSRKWSLVSYKVYCYKKLVMFFSSLLLAFFNTPYEVMREVAHLHTEASLNTFYWLCLQDVSISNLKWERDKHWFLNCRKKMKNILVIWGITSCTFLLLQENVISKSKFRG